MKLKKGLEVKVEDPFDCWPGRPPKTVGRASAGRTLQGVAGRGRPSPGAAAQVFVRKKTEKAMKSCKVASGVRRCGWRNGGTAGTVGRGGGGGGWGGQEGRQPICALAAGQTAASPRCRDPGDSLVRGQERPETVETDTSRRRDI